MGRGKCHHRNAKKKERKIEREFNTGLFLHRALSCGLSMADLSELSIGMVQDIFIEKANDHYEYPILATQEDIDRL